jgi:hypothetical protein
MNNAIVTKLGDIVPGNVNKETYIREGNDPTPIVLWSQGVPEDVFYYSFAANDGSGKYSQKIARITEKETGLGARMKSAFKDFPIKFSATISDKKHERTLDFIEPDRILTADLNGDGAEEMIVFRQISGIHVYNARKKLFDHTPSSRKPNIYEYQVTDIHRAALNGKQLLFAVINRRPYDSADNFSGADRAFHGQTKNYAIYKIDDTGVSELFLADFDWKIAKVLCVGVLNRPGSRAIDEILVCSRKEKSDDIYFSRHKSDGTLIGEPRKAYVEIKDDRLTFEFIEHSQTMLLRNRSKDHVYFFSPEKPANWIRHLDLRNLLKADHGTLLLRPLSHPEGLLALVRLKEKIYALDQESRFYCWDQGRLVARKERQLLLEIRLESPLHELVDVIPAPNDETQFLVIQSRKPQVNKLSDEQVIQAARRFLSSEEIEFCETKLKRASQLNDFMKTRAKTYCKEKGISLPDLKSVEDLKQYLPEVYDWFVAYAHSGYVDCLSTRLFYPITNDNFGDKSVDDGDYVAKNDYKIWLKNLFVPAQTVFKVININGYILCDRPLENLSVEPQQSDLYQLSLERFKSNGKRSHLVITLQKSGLGQTKEVAYYWIQW